MTILSGCDPLRISSQFSSLFLNCLPLASLYPASVKLSVDHLYHKQVIPRYSWEIGSRTMDDKILKGRRQKNGLTSALNLWSWSILVCLNSLLDSEYKVHCQRCKSCNYLENNDLKIKCLIVQQSYIPKCYQCHGFTVDTVHMCSLMWFCLLTVHTTKSKSQYGSLRSQGLCNDMRLLGYSVSVVISL